MRKHLDPFQVIGAARLAHNFHHLLADEPGLGKTVQAIAAAEMVGASQVFVICPASVRTRWQEELEECLGHVPNSWDIVSYNEADALSREPRREKYDVAILDEAHFLKTVEAQRTQAVFGNGRGLARKARYIWPLTGTPVLNRPRELYPILKTLHPIFAKSTFQSFAYRYCGAYFDGRGLNTKGATHLDELAELLRPFMTRRTKREVFPNRKAPLVSIVPLDVSSADLADVYAAEQEIMDRESLLSPTKETWSQLGDMSRLLRLTGLAKAREAAAYTIDLLQTVDKVVVFFHHTDVGERLFASFLAAGLQPAMYRGGMTDAAKDDQKRVFTHTEACRVFLGQIQAAGTGVDGLQKVCRDVVFAEQSWVPGSMGQAIDRLDRMGQRGEFVTARILHAPGTLEGAQLGSRASKAAVIGYLMGDEGRAAMDFGGPSKAINDVLGDLI